MKCECHLVISPLDQFEIKNLFSIDTLLLGNSFKLKKVNNNIPTITGNNIIIYIQITLYFEYIFVLQIIR